MTTENSGQVNDQFSDEELLMAQIRKPDSLEQAEYIAVAECIEGLLKAGAIEPAQLNAAYNAHLKSNKDMTFAERTEAMIASFEGDKSAYNKLRRVQLAAKIEYQGGADLEQHTNTINRMHNAYEPESPVSPETKSEAARIIALHRRAMQISQKTNDSGAPAQHMTAEELASLLPPGFDGSNLEGMRNKGPEAPDYQPESAPTATIAKPTFHGSLEMIEMADDGKNLIRGTGRSIGMTG